MAAIARDANLHEIRELIAKSGFVTLRSDGMRKVIGGLTTADEVLNVTVT